MVSHPLDKGSFGTIYECIDLNHPNQVFVIKISENYQMLGREIEALKDIKNC
jgi:serine/threonine protein kinase